MLLKWNFKFRENIMERNFLICVCVLCLFASHVTGQGAAAPTEGKIWDLVVYGGTSGGIAAAVQARRMALEVVVIEPTQRIGGLTTGGLGQTDIGNKWAVGGIAREFYRAVRAMRAAPIVITWRRASRPMWCRATAPRGSCQGSSRMTRTPGRARATGASRPTASVCA